MHPSARSTHRDAWQIKKVAVLITKIMSVVSVVKSLFRSKDDNCVR